VLILLPKDREEICLLFGGQPPKGILHIGLQVDYAAALLLPGGALIDRGHRQIRRIALCQGGTDLAEQLVIVALVNALCGQAILVFLVEGREDFRSACPISLPRVQDDATLEDRPARPGCCGLAGGGGGGRACSRRTGSRRCLW
jgi:hypothetical protein